VRRFLSRLAAPLVDALQAPTTLVADFLERLSV
jgi:hypothetical protein